MQIVIYVKRRVLDWRRDTGRTRQPYRGYYYADYLQRSFVRAFSPTRRSLQTGESGIDRCHSPEFRDAFDGEIAIIDAHIFVPTASTLRSEVVSPASRGS